MKSLKRSCKHLYGFLLMIAVLITLFCGNTAYAGEDSGITTDENSYINDDLHYETATLKIAVEAKHTDYTVYWLCHVETFNPQQLRSAFCGGTYGLPLRKTSEEVAAHNGILGINGSGFSYETGQPSNGKLLIKNGEIYNNVPSNMNIMCITQDGSMYTAAGGLMAEDLIARTVHHTFCFGPTLVMNGEAFEPEKGGDFREVYRKQRMAIGMVNPGDYYILATNGKDKYGSQGMSYTEMAQIFIDLGCTYAYNLDGGGSVSLVFKGRLLNHPTDAKGERAVGDIIYFVDAGDGAEGDEIIVHEEEGMLSPSSESVWN